MKFIPMAPKLVGPPATKATAYVFQRLQDNCVECECCGEKWHFKAEFIKGKPIQVNVGGQIMAVRKAMYMAAFPEKRIQKGRRISSRSKNQNCINPALLTQSTASELLKSHYTKGIRSKTAASAHLVAQRRKNAKLSPDDVIRIINDDRKGAAAAHEFGISKEHYNAIQRGAARRVANPFAGLIR